MGIRNRSLQSPEEDTKSVYDSVNIDYEVAESNTDPTMVRNNGRYNLQSQQGIYYSHLALTDMVQNNDETTLANALKSFDRIKGIAALKK